MPDIVPLYQPGESITVRASDDADLVGGRFVTVDSAKADGKPVEVTYPAAGAPILGVLHADAARGEVATILTHGHVVPITAGGTVRARDAVSTDSSGRAVRAVAADFTGRTDGTAIVGIALGDASSGEAVLVQIR